MQKKLLRLWIVFSLAILSLNCGKKESRSPENGAQAPLGEPFANPFEPQPTAPQRKVAADWERVASQNGVWSDFVFNALIMDYQPLLRVDFERAESFCANFYDLTLVERANFYLLLLGAISRFESNHRPQTSFRENFKDSRGQYVISRGLLQISFESARGYRCPIRRDPDLHDPLINLDCGLRILDRWVRTDQTLSRRDPRGWRGAARYWAVLRRPQLLRQIQQMTARHPICSR